MRIVPAKGFSKQVPVEQFIKFVVQFQRSAIVLHIAELSKAKLFAKSKTPDTLSTWSSMAILAKTALLFGDDEKPQPNDAGWERLFVAANSIARRPDDPRDDPVAVVIQESIKIGADQRILYREELKYLAGRMYIMLHDLCSQPQHKDLDVGSMLRQLIGIDLETYWFLIYGLFAFFSGTDKTMVSFKKESVLANLNPDIQPKVEKDLSLLLSHVSSDIADFRTLYDNTTVMNRDGAPVRKYKLEDEPRYLYATEPNPLRDFPLLHVPGDSFICPITPWLFLRAFSGVYYDLIDMAGRIERERGGGRQHTFQVSMGKVFQEYIGVQLRQVLTNDEMAEEFEYEYKGSARSPDFIIRRNSGAPVFVECKIRRPQARFIATGSVEDTEDELEKGIAKALGQIAEFILRANEGTPQLEDYAGLAEHRALIVLFDTFPMHCVEPLRSRSVEIACRMKPHCAPILKKMRWFAASAHELEHAVAVAGHFNVHLDRLCELYLEYLAQAPPVVHYRKKKGREHMELRLEWAEFMRHRYRDGTPDNALITDAFDRFSRRGMEYYGHVVKK